MKTEFFKRHPTLTLIGINLILLVLLVVGGEWGVRLIQGCNGYTTNPQIKCVRQLEVYDDMFTDADGIFRLNPDSSRIHEKLAADKLTAINRAGFRTLEFDTPRDGSPRVLLLGDSFTFGASAIPITQSFADQITAAGFQVFNTGIPGTGPEQYAQVAGKYLPLLAPDIVVTALFLGNDIQPRPDPVLPDHPLHYNTNAGMLRGYDRQNRPLTAQQAYANVFDNHYYYKNDGSLRDKLRKLLSRSLIGVALLDGVYQLKQLARAGYRQVAPALRSGATGGCSPDYSPFMHVRHSLLAISELASQAGIPHLLFVIPAPPDASGGYLVTDPLITELLAGLDPQISAMSEASDYTPAPDFHFNNQGHRKFAELIIAQLRQTTASAIPALATPAETP